MTKQDIKVVCCVDRESDVASLFDLSKYIIGVHLSSLFCDSSMWQVCLLCPNI